MKVKVTYTIRWKENNKYCSTEHIEINEDDLLEYIKKYKSPSTDELFIENEIEITGFKI